MRAAAVSLFAALAAGCSPTPEWHTEVAPLVAEHCGACHTAGGIAPMAFDTYEQAAPWAAAMAGSVESGSMPPWGAVDTEACANPRGWRHDPRPEPEDVVALRRWADAGAPEGDPADAVPLPSPVTSSLAEETARLAPRSAYTVTGDGDDFACVVYDPGWTEDVWLTGFEVLPDQLEVVHHAIVDLDPERRSEAFVDEDGHYPCFGGTQVGGSMLGGWVPGSGAVQYPEGSGLQAPAGSLIVVQYHYNGVGEPVDDATELALRWTDEPPDFQVVMTLQGNSASAAQGLQPSASGETEFLVPAGATDHLEEIRLPLGGGSWEAGIWMVGNHMHLVGASMQLWLERANPGPGQPASECLLDTPSWDFYWQRFYEYDEDDPWALPRVSGDDTLVLKCRYDNSLGNPFVREALADEGLEAPVDVVLGDGTLDEMCLGVFGALVPR